MGVMRVLNSRGDIRVEWDPADRESTAKAKDEYDRLKKDGYEFFEVTETKGKRVDRWNKNAKTLIASPGVQKPIDKLKGSRPKAMAGQPIPHVAGRLR